MERQEKSPEQIQAELKIKQEALAATLHRKKGLAGDIHFVHEDRVYVPLFPVLSIPTIGERTALEICVDEEAQAYLVKNGQGVIKEVL